jgi:hypothetical protein
MDSTSAPASTSARVTAGPGGEARGEQPLAKLVGVTDRAQGGVQDGDAVAEALGLLEPVGGEEDRDAALAELVDAFTRGGRLIQVGEAVRFSVTLRPGGRLRR